MMILRTRKEQYLNEIVGGGNTAPETPQTREELFYAAILGEVVAPSPITRAEKYLAKIANKYNGELPEPVTRIERFLARAAGMNVSIPTPITREEMFWADYALIVEKELSGIPPLTFNAIAGALKNYRIYGNAVNDENVGDLITEGEHAGEYEVPVTVEGKNLFSTELEQGNILNDGTLVDSESRLRTKNYLPCEKGDYVLSFSGENIKFGCRYYDANYNIITLTGWIVKNSVFIIERINTKYIKFNFAKNDTTENISPSDITNIQLEKGSTATAYEPYQPPVTTPIYLPEPIKMVGDEAEYIDYAEQKMHRIGADDVDVTLPALPTIKGTNVLSVGTAVQPSKVYVKYKGERQ